VTVAYNFRGVGQSEGVYDEGVGEQEDLLTVVAWAKATFVTEPGDIGGVLFWQLCRIKGARSFNH